MKLEELNDRLSDISCLSSLSFDEISRNNSELVDTCFHDKTFLYRLDGTSFAMMVLGCEGIGPIIVWVKDCMELTGPTEDSSLVTFEEVIDEADPDLITELLFHIDVFASSEMAFDFLLI